MANRKERIEYIALPALVLVLTAVVVWRYFSPSEGAAPPVASVASDTSAPKTKAPTKRVQTPQMKKVADLTSFETLDLSQLTRKPVAVGKSERGNIFNFYVAPPRPPEPVKPPPIQLTGIEPTQVFAMTKGFTLKVRAVRLPADARIMIDGIERQTTTVSETELSTPVSETLINNSGSHTVEVRASDPTLSRSNQASLVIVAPPTPPYTYIGLISTNEGSTAVLLDRETRRRAFKGKAIDQKGRWVVLEITTKEIRIRDTELDIVHRIAFTGE